MRHLLILGIFILSSCSTNQNSSEEYSKTQPDVSGMHHHIDELTKVFDAHGGYDQWTKMKSLYYVKGKEATITNLENRKIRLESPDQIIGFDGKDVWVQPDTVDASRARFYHNLYFYFYAMPFVVGDPGAYYEVMGQRIIQGKEYNQIKVSYGKGVGDAPDDNYMILSDPQTNKMEWLMYTVTYRSGEPSDDYHIIKYGDWSEFNGLFLPTSLEWFVFENDSVGSSRSKVIFEEINISEQYPDSSLFIRPEGSQIAPL